MSDIFAAAAALDRARRLGLGAGPETSPENTGSPLNREAMLGSLETALAARGLRGTPEAEAVIERPRVYPFPGMYMAGAEQPLPLLRAAAEAATAAAVKPFIITEPTPGAFQPGVSRVPEMSSSVVGGSARAPMPLPKITLESLYPIDVGPSVAPQPQQPPQETEPEYGSESRIVIGPKGVPLLTNRVLPEARSWSPGSPGDRQSRASEWLASRRVLRTPEAPVATPDMSMANIAGRIRTAQVLNDLYGAEGGLRLEEQKRRTEELAQERAQEEATITPEQAHLMRMQLERERHPEAKSVDALMQIGEQVLNDPQTKERFAQRYGYEQQMKADPAWFTKLPKDAQEDVARVIQETDALLQLQRILVGANRGRLYEPKEDQDFLSASGVPQGQPQQPR